MPFPIINAGIDSFFEPTRILLFGKPFPVLWYNPAPMQGLPAFGGAGPAVNPEFEPYVAPEQGQGVAPPAVDLPMPPGPVELALRQVGNEGIFARIYGFSFEGHYYKLSRPLLFLVRGEGDRTRAPEEAAAAGVRQFNTRFTGIEGKDWQFGNDILVWAVDKHEIAVCLDLDIGTYDQVLLQSFAAGRDESTFRGHAGSRGAANFRGAMFGPHQDR